MENSSSRIPPPFTSDFGRRRMHYHYLDEYTSDRIWNASEDADEVELEEVKEYKVRSAVITSIACMRAKDRRTPPAGTEF
jgi:hypothetical protein